MQTFRKLSDEIFLLCCVTLNQVRKGKVYVCVQSVFTLGLLMLTCFKFSQ